MNIHPLTNALFSYSCPISLLVPTLKDGHEWKKRARVRLASENFPLYRPPVAAKSATGFCRPINNRRHSVQEFADAFFVSAISFYGGCAWDTFGCAGFLLSWSANPRTATTLIRFAANRGSSSTMGATHMTTLIPSAIRALAHRRMALSALRANSSLSVRLKRYNHHMTIVRTLESVGGVA